MMHDQTYFYRFDGQQSQIEFLGFEQDGIQLNGTFFAQDPTDNICVDSIEALLKYMGCHGK